MRQSEALLQEPLFPDDYRCAPEHDPGTASGWSLSNRPLLCRFQNFLRLNQRRDGESKKHIFMSCHIGVEGRKVSRRCGAATCVCPARQVSTNGRASVWLAVFAWVPSKTSYKVTSVVLEHHNIRISWITLVYVCAYNLCNELKVTGHYQKPFRLEQRFPVSVRQMELVIRYRQGYTVGMLIWLSILIKRADIQ